MKAYFFLILVTFVMFFPCKAQADDKNLFSLDFSYSITSLLNYGWGAGFNYERILNEHFSLKGNFGHMTLSTGIKNIYCTSVHISFFANYFPFGGLDKLYFVAGTGCDFMNYFGSGDLPSTAGDILIHVTPKMGWKINLLKFLKIDLSIGYKFIITETQNYENIEDFVNAGFIYGIGFKILFNQIGKNGKKSFREDSAALSAN